MKSFYPLALESGLIKLHTDPVDSGPFESIRVPAAELVGRGCIGGTIKALVEAESQSRQALRTMLASLGEQGFHSWLTAPNDFLAGRMPLEEVRDQNDAAVQGAIEADQTGYYA